MANYRKPLNNQLRVESEEVPDELKEVLDSTPTVTERNLEKREGKKPGRPRKAVKYEDIIQATNDQLYLLLHFVPEALAELVNGVKVLEYDTNKGKEVVYRKPPDVQAIKLLLEKTLGKTPMHVEHSGNIQHTGIVNLEMSMSDDEMVDVLQVALDELKKKQDSEPYLITQGEESEEDDYIVEEE